MSGQRVRRIAAIVALPLALVLVLALAGCGGSTTSSSGSTSGATGGTPATTPSAAGATVVVMKNFAFDPSTVTAKVGQPITFKNEDSAQHNVKINGQESGLIDPGKDWTVKIDKAGSYPFSCIIHPSMTGQLTVQ